jgi:acetolactate synthase-1/2/3 large subunit
LKVAEILAESLIRLRVRHTFGVGGANIEDLFLAVQRRRPRLQAVLCKHEHAAGSAADAYARLSGGLGVVLVTSGGGAMNLVHAIAEARASRVRLLALVGEPPTSQQGRGAFQDTSGLGGCVDAAAIFSAVTPDCTRIQQPSDLLAWIERACIGFAGWSGPRVLLLAKDVQQADVELPSGWLERLERTGRKLPASNSTAELSQTLGVGAITVIAGAEVARGGATRELAELVERLDACVVVAPDARDAFDNAHSRFAGVVGAMGHASAAAALSRAQTILVVGARLSLLERLGVEMCLEGKRVMHMGSEAPFVACTSFDCGANLAAELAALNERLPRAPAASGCVLDSNKIPDSAAEKPTQPIAAPSELRTGVALQLLEKYCPADATVLVDAGNTGASAAHHLHAPRSGRWLLAMGMAGMGYTYGAAVGAAFATGRRVFLVSGDGAFFMHGLEVHTAVEHDLPITYLVLDNAAHGMCLVREHLLLGRSSGYNTFRRSRLGAGLAAMFPGLPAFDCASAEELDRALSECASATGPCFVSAHLPTVEVPPFAAFSSAHDRGIDTVERDARSGAPS